ncbi:putative esterase domain protein [Mycobacterium xenopi 3993]|nr:putative esterase domain protein [Mycobacterium xenopi 3993]
MPDDHHHHGDDQRHHQRHRGGGDQREDAVASTPGITPRSFDHVLLLADWERTASPVCSRAPRFLTVPALPHRLPAQVATGSRRRCRRTSRPAARSTTPAVVSAGREFEVAVVPADVAVLLVEHPAVAHRLVGLADHGGLVTARPAAGA